MNTFEFKSLFDLLQAFPTEQSCIEYLELCRWRNGLVSPYDPASKVYNYGGGKYRCKNTGLNFNVKTGTVFQKSKVPLIKWFVAIWFETSHKKGISSIQLSKDISVTQKTAWHMLHRIRECFYCENDHKLDGEVELDETFVGGKNKNRHANEKIKNSQVRSYKDKTPVLGMLERGGKVVCRVINDTSKRSLTVPILRTVKRSARLYTDEWCGYDTIGRIYVRNIVDHGKGQYVDGDSYTNSIESFWATVKRSIIGIYHKTSRKHLHRYMNEYVFRYNTRKMNETERFNLLLCNVEYHITYKSLTE